jgi:hypothetical protein
VFRLQQAISTTRFDYFCKRILSTPPVQVEAGGLTAVSMVSKRDVLKYLVAAKTLLLELGEGRPVVLNDGSLEAKDMHLLSLHLRKIGFMNLYDTETGGCPRGGCWERLVTILCLARDGYVIQLDSDTITCGVISEVKECYRAKRSFTLGTGMGRAFVSLEESARMIEKSSSNHIQVVAERLLRATSDPDTRRYVRGSAGFAGFAREYFDVANLERFSIEMQRLTRSRWSDWGFEIAFNYMVANSPIAEVLSYPRYACFDPRIERQESAFPHFVGPHQYRGQVHSNLARLGIVRLGRKQAASTAPME